MLDDILVGLGKNVDEISENEAKAIMDNIAKKLAKKIEENPTTKINDLFN
ncbi:hypothetical protein ACFQO9_17340 [Chryseobacterium zhengzhouense]|uniref:Uncharacterized protein n=1 Tax=Chryseobacterium zhengzhouense TaxID=1636086 RepID=A0ABW2M3W8_9FLAO